MAQNESTFNSQAYLAANPDVAASGLDPWYHYQTWGKNEGRPFYSLDVVAAPAAEKFFDEQSYLAANPDVAQAVRNGQIESGWQHYDIWGKNEGRAANFSGLAKDVAIANPDIQYIDLEGSEYTPESLYNLKQSNPSLYAKTIADKLGQSIFNSYISNISTEPQTKQLEALKELNPQAYYENKLKFLGQQVGWQIGQNRSERNAPTIAQIQSLIPEAQKAGLSTDQISSLINNSVNQANIQNQSRIANEAAGGGPGVFSGFTQALPMFGALGLAALTEGILNPATLGVTSAAEGAGGAAGGLNAYMASAGLAPGTFEGAAFTIPNLAGYTGMADYMSQAGLDAGNFTNTALAGPTYGELGYTGLEPGQMGPTYGELGYTGLNNAEAIAAADAAAKGMTLSDALSYANKARQGLGLASTLAKMVGGGQTSGATRSTGGTSGINPQQLASLLRPNQYQGLELAQITPKNPFLFTPQGQTQASEGMYDVSGSNPMANALRNR